MKATRDRRTPGFRVTNVRKKENQIVQRKKARKSRLKLGTRTFVIFLVLALAIVQVHFLFVNLDSEGRFSSRHNMSSGLELYKGARNSTIIQEHPDIEHMIRSRRRGHQQNDEEKIMFPLVPLIKNGHHEINWNKEIPSLIDMYPSRRNPAFLIIGTQKAGTTAFFGNCQKHPQITVPIWKELHFFAGRNMPSPDKDINSIKRMYRLLFGNATYNCPACVSGEATPQYLRFPNTAIPLIKKVCPWVKLVVLLREPISRAISSFKMLKRSQLKEGKTDNTTFEELANEDFDNMAKSGLLRNWTEEEGWLGFDVFAESIEEERAYSNLEEIELNKGFSDFSGVITNGLIHRGLYELQLRQWIRAFGSENFLVINTDKDRVGPELCNRFYNFLGLEETLGPLQPPPDTIDTNSNKDLIMISKALKRKLENFFSPYNKRLGSLLGEEWAGNVWRY